MSDYFFLDSYYYYAPVPRALRLRELLSKRELNARRLTLLFVGFSSPNSLINSITRLLTGEGIGGAYELVWGLKRETKGKTRLFGLSSMIKDFLYERLGRSPKVCLTSGIPSLLGEEDLSLLEFLERYFTSKLDRLDVSPPSAIKISACFPQDKICISHKGLRYIINNYYKVLREIATKYNNIFTKYNSYMVCKVARILEINMVGDYRERVKDITSTEVSFFLSKFNCRKCSLPRHEEDVKKALFISEFALNNLSSKIYVAPIASIVTEKWDECFSCLVSKLGESTANVIVVK